MNAQLAFFALDVATAFAALRLGLRALQRWRLPAAQLIALIAFDSICDVLLGRSDYSYWIPAALQIDIHGVLAVIFNLARNLTPFLFAAFCFVEFADRPRFPRWLYPLLIAQLFSEEALVWYFGPTAAYADVAVQIAPSLLQTLFVVIALYWTIAGWRGDLIESRRRTRLLLSIAIGINMLFSGILMRLVIGPLTFNTPANYYTHVAVVFSHLVLLMFVLFQLADSGIDTYLDPLRPAAPQPPISHPDSAALTRLAALMQEERLYRRAGLTLKTLADTAGVPEYRLRRLIHEQLGFANFNAYLHAWRVREACEHLRDPAQRRTPILTIALSVGYRSVNTFNRGFRDVTGMAPSTWRAQVSSSEAVGRQADDNAPIPPSPKTA